MNVVAKRLSIRRLVALRDVAGADSLFKLVNRDEAEALLVDDGSAMFVSVNFELSVMLEESESPLLELNVDLELEYARAPNDSATQGVSPDDLMAFARINGTHNAWPYIREAISSLTTRVGYPPLTLPLLIISKAKELGVRAGKPSPKRTPGPPKAST